MLSDAEVNLLCAEIAAEAAEETLDAENEVLWNSIVANIMAVSEMYTKEYESEWD